MLWLPDWRKRFLPPDMPPDIYPQAAFRGVVSRWNLSELCMGEDKGQALFPGVDRRAHLVDVGVAIVDRSNAGDGAGNVIEQFSR